MSIEDDLNEQEMDAIDLERLSDEISAAVDELDEIDSQMQALAETI